MKDKTHTTFRSTLSVVLAILTLGGIGGIAGCNNDDSISEAEKSDIVVPGIEETKAIAEEGYIYGLPIVMNYAVMYAYAVDRNSGQFKAPFNKIMNEARVFTYKDTAIVTPNSDTPYSFLWMDLRAEPMVLSVPAVEEGRYYAVQLEDGNTFNFGYIGSRATGNEAGDFLVVGPGWKGATPPGIKKVFHSTTAVRARGLPHPALQPRGHAERREDPGRLQGPAALAYLDSGRRRPAARPLEFPKIDKEMVKTGFFDYLDFALQFAPPGPEEKEIRARLASIGIGPGKTFDFKDLSSEHKAEIALGMKEGEAKVENYLKTQLKIVNGWKISSTSATARSSTATGCCAQPGPRPGSTATMRSRRPIRWRRPMPRAIPSTAASTTTRSPSPPERIRPSTPSGR